MALQWLRSGLRSGVLVAVAVCSGVASTSVTAQEPPLQGNPQKGKELSYPCLGCHGVEGYKNAYPNYSVPELEGQRPEYLSAALKEYRDGDRAPLTMHPTPPTRSDHET